MLRTNGRTWAAGNATLTGDYGNLGAGTVGSRTALRYTGSGGAVCRYQDWDVYRAAGPISRAADAVKNALLIDGWLAFPELDCAAAFPFNVLETKLWDGFSATGLVDVVLFLYYDGAAYNLSIKRTLGGVSDYAPLGTVTEGDTFHRYTAYVFADKCYTSVDGGTPTETTWTTASAAGFLFPGSVALNFQGSAGYVVRPAWDALRVDVEEYEAAATAGTSRTNGNPDNGVLYLIEKTALAGLVTAGTAYEFDVVNGAATLTGVTANKDYLAAKVLTDNDAGFAQKLNLSAGGDWTPSAWSLP